MKYLNYKKATLNSSAGDYGTLHVEFADILDEDDLIIGLRQPAFLSGDINAPYYTATARNIRDEDDIYFIIWDIHEGYDPKISDESDACDWDNPRCIIGY